MKTRILMMLVAISAVAAPSYARIPPTAVPEIDYKLAVGGLVVAIAAIALLIESYRRRKAASN